MIDDYFDDVSKSNAPISHDHLTDNNTDLSFTSDEIVT